MKPSSQRVPRRHLALGVILGVGLGLLVDSVLVLMLRYLIVYYIVFSLGLIVILPIVKGIKLGIRFVRNRSPRELSWPALLLLACALWPTVIALPFGLRLVQLRLIAPAVVPAYPRAERVSVRVRLGDLENSFDSVHFVFSTEADSTDVVDFFRDRLVGHNWVEEGTSPTGQSIHGTRHTFRQRSGRSIRIEFHESQPEGKLQVEIIYGPRWLLG